MRPRGYERVMSEVRINESPSFYLPPLSVDWRVVSVGNISVLRDVISCQSFNKNMRN